MPEQIRAALEDLEKVAGEHAAAREQLRELTLRRDFLIVALHRRGVSLRVIARAAGLHYTRIRQMAREADDVASEAGLKRATALPPHYGPKPRRGDKWRAGAVDRLYGPPRPLWRPSESI